MTPLKLYPYQEVGSDWLARTPRALLGDGMGLGKTAQVITAIEKLKLKKILIIAPPIARITWEREFHKWSHSPHEIQILEKLSDNENPHANVTICSFKYASTNYKALGKIRRDLLVVDESHYLKTLETKRTQAILAKGGLIHASKRSWFLTGTPMPNHPGELWVTLYCFGVTKLGYEAWVTRYCRWYNFNGRRNISGAKKEMLSELSRLLTSIMLRRVKEEVLKDLPPVTVSALPIEAKLTELTPEVKKQFKELSAVMQSLERLTNPVAQLNALTMVAESVSTLRRYCAVMKAEAVADLVCEELDANAYPKIVIFAIHREAIQSMLGRLTKFNPVSIHGGTGPQQRQAAIDAFQNDPGCRVLVANIQAASTNITLTSGNQAIFLEQSWVPGDNAQAIARLARIGQRHNVYIRLAGLYGTVDEKVQEILNSKSEEIRLLLETKVQDNNQPQTKGMI